MNITNTVNKNCKELIFNMLFLFGTLLLLSSCSTEPIDELSKNINIALRNDNIINESEWNSFTKYVNKNKQYLSNLIENDTVSSIKLKDLILSIAKDTTKPKIFDPTKKPDTEKAEIKVFIENSGSMDGYVRNNSEFKVTLLDLLVQIQHRYGKENLNVNFINTKIHPSEVDKVSVFIEQLDPSIAPYRVGNRSVSKLNEILKMILESTKQGNISILISDCIYSLEEGTGGTLEFQKILTKGAFLEKSKEFDFSTIVLKMNSKFDGYFYDKNKGKIYLNKKSRPYYIWIIGKENLISSFSKNINLYSLKGFENSYYLSNSTKNKQPFYMVLEETKKIGKCKRADRKTKYTKSIKDIEYKNGKFQFSIAIDLNNVNTEDSYFMDVNNYETLGGFTVKSIDKIEINNMKGNDYIKISKTSATHFITIEMNQDYPIQDLQLELSNKIPSWVYESNSIDDTDIINQLDKTFGLLYLIQGVSEAYTIQNPNNKSYFKIIVTIKK